MASEYLTKSLDFIGYENSAVCHYTGLPIKVVHYL